MIADLIESAELFHGMPEEQYHAETGLGEDRWLTRSMVADYIASPSGFSLRHVERHPYAQRAAASKSMALGTYLDVMVTEGMEAFHRRFVNPPYSELPREWLTPGGAISKGKPAVNAIERHIADGLVYREIPASIDAYMARYPGCEAVDPAMYDLATFMLGRLGGNPLAARIIQEAEEGQPVVRATLNNSLRVQCRVDLLCPDLGLAADLKTTKDSKEDFLRSAVKYGYHIQAALYSSLLRAAGVELRQPFLFVCAQNQYPFDAYVLELPEELYSWADRTTEKALVGIGSSDYITHQSASYVPMMPYWLANVIDEEQSA